MFDSSMFHLGSSRRIQLRDGSRCRIRPVSRTDSHHMVDCFNRLSTNSRRMRFFAIKQGLSQQDMEFFSSADGFDHIALLAVRLDIFGEEREALGFARCIRMENASDSAEISLAVADDVQRLGVGSTLLDRLSELAASAGIRRFFCDVLIDNRGMRVLAKRIGGQAHWQGDGTVRYEWAVTGAAGKDFAGWPARSGQDFAKSMELWSAIFTQSMRIGMQQYDAMLRRYPVPSLEDLRHIQRWAL